MCSTVEVKIWATKTVVVTNDAFSSFVKKSQRVIQNSSSDRGTLPYNSVLPKGAPCMCTQY